MGIVLLWLEDGSRRGELKWRSEIIVVIQPAETGTEIIDEEEVKKIDRGNKGKNKEECKIERLEPFNKVAIELLFPCWIILIILIFSLFISLCFFP